MLILSPVHRWRLPAAAAFAILLLLVACKKNETPPAPNPTTVVTSLSSQNLHAGDTLFLRGKSFGSSASVVHIQLDTFTLTIDRCQDTVIAVILPSAARLHYYGSRTLQLNVAINTNTGFSKSYGLTVLCPEPKGWFDAYRGSGVLNYIGVPTTNISLAFANDTIGYLHYKDHLLKTRDGGFSWASTQATNYGNALCLSVLDTANVWSGDIGFVNNTRDGGNSWTNHRLPAGLNNVIIGQYMTSPTTGLIASGQGTIYSISGTSFDATSEFTLDYQSKWKINYLQWQSLSAVDGNNLLITGVGNDSTVYPVAQRPLVAVKTNGTYEEYLLPTTATSATGIFQVQLLTNALGFAIDGNNDILKYTGSRNWSLLQQKATAILFTDNSTGYAAWNEKIYMTVDGGQNWTSVCSLRTGDEVINFATRNGRLWALGNNQNGNGWFVEKYNP